MFIPKCTPQNVSPECVNNVWKIMVGLQSNVCAKNEVKKKQTGTFWYAVCIGYSK